MRRWTRNDTQDDPPKDPEVFGWFYTLGPPPEGQAPPDLRVKVLARIAQQRARRRMFAWMSSVGSPAWAAALAMVLVVSVGLNVWWGVRGFGPLLSGHRQAADTSLGDLGTAGRLRTYRFQVEMARATALGTFVAAHPARWEPSAVVGFTPQAARTAYFRMGTLYAEALASLHGGTTEAAAPRLDILMQALASVQAPRALSQYLREMQTLLQNRRYEDAVVARFLALFEPLYEDAYARTNAAEGLLLFRAGAWVENLYLAAAAGDRAAVRQGGEAVVEFRHAFIQLQAPPETLAALARLRPLIARQALSDQEIGTIRALAQDIQGMLSE
jgi:hypothetical protein